MKSLASFWSPSTYQSDTVSISEASTTTHYTAATQQYRTEAMYNTQHGVVVNYKSNGLLIIQFLRAYKRTKLLHIT